MKAFLWTWTVWTRKTPDLCVTECTSETQSEKKPNRVVVQYIQGTVHAWEEHVLESERCMCIVQIQPNRKHLKPAEATRLLESSDNWRQADHQENLQKLQKELAGKVSHPVSATWPPGNSSAFGDDRLPQYRIRTNETEVMDLSILATSGQPVANTTEFPWYNVGRLVSNFRNSTGLCSFFLVSPYLALTNAHCLFTEEGERTNAIFAAPAQYVSEGRIVHPYGTFRACSFAWPDSYEPTAADPGNFASDYAAAFISRSPTSTILEGMTFMPLEFDTELSIGTTLNMAGYSTEQMMKFTGSTTSFTFHPDLSSDGRILYFAMPAGPGSSGGPVWLRDSAAPRAIALNAGVMIILSEGIDGSTQEFVREVGTRFVPQNYDLITSWLEEANNHQSC